MNDSPAVVLFDSNGVELAVSDGVAIPVGTRGVVVLAKDGSTARALLVDASGRPIVVGAGAAGTPAGGVVSVQGVPGGEPIAVSGSFTSSGLTDAELRASPVPVSGPLTDGQLRASAVPVSGPLTDAQLRATPVPVSGTVTATGPLTDTQLRASPVPVSGTVSTGGLTDTQLRASPVPVSGSVSTGDLTDAQLRASPVPVSGPLTDAQLRASAVPVSLASSPLPTGAATEATLALIKAKTDNLDVALSTRAVTGLTDTQLRATAVPVSGPLTDAQLRATALLVLPDPNVHKFINGTPVTVSGSFTLEGVGGKDVVLIVTAVGDATGTSPELVFRIVEVDPGTLTIEPIAFDITGPSPPDALAFDGASLFRRYANCSSSALKVEWTVTGTTPVFPAIHATLLVKDASITQTADYLQPPIAVQSDGSFDFVTASGSSGSKGVFALGSDPGGAARPLSVYDAWTGIPTEWILGVQLRSSGASGSVETGIAANPLQVAAATLPLPTGASQESTQNLVLARLADGTQETRIVNGANIAAVKAASTAAIATDPALVVAISPNNTIPVSLASSPLPTGAATEATLALVKAKTDNLDAALSTRATEATLSTLNGKILTGPLGSAGIGVAATLFTNAGDELAAEIGTTGSSTQVLPVGGTDPSGLFQRLELGTDGALLVSAVSKGTDSHGDGQLITAQEVSPGKFALSTVDDRVLQALNEQTALLMQILNLLQSR